MNSSARRRFIKQLAVASAGMAALPAWAQRYGASKFGNDHFILPDLPYAYDAFEPFITKETLYSHHVQVHGDYVRSLNTASFLKPHKPLEKLIEDAEVCAEEVRHHLGGHLNHCQLWKAITPGGTPMSDTMQALVHHSFGSIDALWKEVNLEAAKIPGSGWIWLTYENGLLQVVRTDNEDHFYQSNPSSNALPLIGIDVWEHAYYPTSNDASTYLQGIRIHMNWNEIEVRLKQIKMI